jgi:hypothetical protein
MQGSVLMLDILFDVIQTVQIQSAKAPGPAERLDNLYLSLSEHGFLGEFTQI